MTLLAADIGNSHTVLGLLDDGDVRAHWRVATDERRTADEWAVLVRGLLRDAGAGADVDGIAVCSTVPAVLHEWREMLVTHFGDVHAVVAERRDQRQPNAFDAHVGLLCFDAGGAGRSKKPRPKPAGS